MADLPVPDSLKPLMELRGKEMTAREAFALFCLPPRPPLARREQEVISTAKPVPFRFRGREVMAYKWGSGPVVALAHGWGARAGTMTAFVEPLVESGFSVIAPDHLGHGESEGTQCNALWVSQCWDLLAQEHGGFHGAVTHSFGSLGINLYHARGGPLSRVVHLAPFNEVLKRFLEFSAALDMNVQREAGFLSFCEDWFGSGRLASIKGEKLAPQMTAEALIMHDEEDGDIPFSDAEGLAGAWGLSTLVRTKGLGHRRIIREKNVIRQSVSFLSEGKLDAISTQLPADFGILR